MAVFILCPETETVSGRKEEEKSRHPQRPREVVKPVSRVSKGFVPTPLACLSFLPWPMSSPGSV